MTKKKRVNKLAKHLRKTYNLPFIETFKIAKELIGGRFIGNAWKLGFSHEPEWGTLCARGCCRGPTGRGLYIGSDIDGKQIVWNSDDIKYFNRF